MKRPRWAASPNAYGSSTCAPRSARRAHRWQRGTGHRRQCADAPGACAFGSGAHGRGGSRWPRSRTTGPASHTTVHGR
jgi:hypothetical protein